MRKPNLRLRGKLVLGFSIVVAVLTAGLGLAIYATFAQIVHRGHVEQVRREAEAVAATVDALMREREAHVLRSAFALAEGGGAPEDAAGLAGLAAALASDPLVAGVVVLDGQRRRLATAGRVAPADGAMAPPVSPGLHVTEDGGIVVAAGLGQGAPTGGGAVGLHLNLDVHALARAVATARRNPRAAALVFVGEQQLLRVEPDEPAVASRLREALAVVREPRHARASLASAGNAHGVTNPVPTLGWTLVYAVPDDSLQRALTQLRFRITAASGIAFFVGLWIVLVFANRISAPLRRLAAAARDTRGFSGFGPGRPIPVSPTFDEIGDLSRALAALQRDVEASVTKDPLTGVFNRRFLMDALDLELARARRAGHSVACLMLDIDHFKQVNDRHGHRAGDAVLMTVGGLLQTTVRASDIVARYGGEEFCVLAAPVDEEGARSVAERIRSAILRATTMHDGLFLRCTISVGVAITTDGNEPPLELIERADSALYGSKRNGRNRVTVADPLPAAVERRRA